MTFPGIGSCNGGGGGDVVYWPNHVPISLAKRFARHVTSFVLVLTGSPVTAAVGVNVINRIYVFRLLAD